MKAEGWEEQYLGSTKVRIWKLWLSNSLHATIAYKPECDGDGPMCAYECYIMSNNTDWADTLDKAIEAVECTLAQELSTATQSVENMKGKG